MGLAIRLHSYLQGYVVFRVSGGGIEAFVNLAARRGIPLRGLQRLGERVAVGQVPASQFARLRLPARTAGVNLRLVRRAGLPFLTARIRRRPGLVAGGLVAAALVGVLASRVWDVEVLGPSEVNRDAVVQALARMGVRPGAARHRIVPEELERNLLLALPDLAWVDVRVRGTVVRVDVRPRRDADRQSLGTGDIVATHDGLVTELGVVAGWPTVQVGDLVREGQVLIAGRLAGHRPVRASGWVKARVWVQGYGESRLQLVLMRPSGRFARGFAARIGPWMLKLGAVDPPFERFRRVEAHRFRLPGPASRVPLALEWVTYEETEPLTIPVAADQARRLAEEQAAEQALARLGDRPEILRLERTSWEEDLGAAGRVLRSRVSVEAVQEIGRFQPHPEADVQPLVTHRGPNYTGMDTTGR